jgi:hypothetical protein
MSVKEVTLGGGNGDTPLKVGKWNSGAVGIVSNRFTRETDSRSLRINSAITENRTTPLSRKNQNENELIRSPLFQKRVQRVNEGDEDSSKLKIKVRDSDLNSPFRRTKSLTSLNTPPITETEGTPSTPFLKVKKVSFENTNEVDSPTRLERSKSFNSIYSNASPAAKSYKLTFGSKLYAELDDVDSPTKISPPKHTFSSSITTLNSPEKEPPVIKIEEKIVPKTTTTTTTSPQTTPQKTPQKRQVEGDICLKIIFNCFRGCCGLIRRCCRLFLSCFIKSA